MNFQVNGWVCVLVKTISHVAVVAVGQSADSSMRGHLRSDSQMAAGFVPSILH